MSIEPDYSSLDPEEKTNRYLAMASVALGVISLCLGQIPMCGGHLGYARRQPPHGPGGDCDLRLQPAYFHRLWRDGCLLPMRYIL